MATGPRIGAPVPVLRVQSWDHAEAFYTDYLGFDVDWVHRFEPDMPAYVRVARDGATLDLSEHHGDGTPGSTIWVPVGDVGALHRELHERPYRGLRPGVDVDAPGGPTLEVLDPCGNTLRFCQVRP